MLMSLFEGGGGVCYFCCMYGFYYFDFGEKGFIFVFESFLKILLIIILF